MGEIDEVRTHQAPNERKSAATGPVRAVLRLRTLGPFELNPPQTEVIDRLRTLTEDDPRVDLDVDVWQPSMGSAWSDDRDPFDGRETVAEFEQWADEQECTLRPAFDRRSDALDDEEGRGGRIITPLITLALYDEERLRAVYPHGDGDVIRTIHDGVEALESMLRDAKQSVNEQHESQAVLIE